MTAPTAHADTPLSRLLAERGIHGRELARVTGAHENTVYNWIRGRSAPTPRTARKVADTLGVAVADLWPLTAATPLAAALAERGMTAVDLAAALGVSRSTVRVWLSGRCEPGPRHTAALDALGLLRPRPARRPPPPQTWPRPLTAPEVLAAHATRRRRWRERAVCANGEHDPDLWWPEPPDSGWQTRQAQTLCATCPVLGDCRDAFLADPWPDRDGIVAGLLGHILLRAARQHRQTARHPTRKAS